MQNEKSSSIASECGEIELNLGLTIENIGIADRKGKLLHLDVSDYIIRYMPSNADGVGDWRSI